MPKKKPRKEETLQPVEIEPVENAKEVKEVKEVNKKVSLENKCGLCGKRKQLTKTECCNEWICDDESKYVVFSYARNSCHRNHNRYSLCGYHFIEGHRGEWKKCKQCRRDFDTEMYVWYGTNEYNFSKLENPPAYEPTKCGSCNKIIKLGKEGFSIRGNSYYCQKCARF